MTDVDAARFLQAPLITRAVLLLQRAFRDPMALVPRFSNWISPPILRRFVVHWVRG